MRARLGIALALVAGTLLTAAAPAHADFLKNLTSPGPLAKPHADLESQCDKCHIPFKGVPNSGCLACHTGTQTRIKSALGPHAQYEREGKKCSSCHTDHKGRGETITPKVDASFQHAITGFLLAGKHASAKCATCHKPTASGQPKWVDLPRSCNGCHADVHKPTLGAKCESCHTANGWKPPSKTIEAHTLDMKGGHQGLACASCHTKGEHLTAKSSCGDCHKQNHGGTKAPCATCHNTTDWKSATFKHDFCTCILPGKHQTASCLSCHPGFKFTPTPFECATCHKKDRKHEELGACSQCHSAVSWKTKTFDHNRPFVGFKIDGSHAEVGCENCHKQKGVFKGTPKSCEGCHKTPAHGDFGGCAKCHATTRWLKTTFSHDRTPFPLDGQHKDNINALCQDCHSQFKKGEFTKGPNQCSVCHKDPHKGQFAAPPPPSAPHGSRIAPPDSNGVLFAGPPSAAPPPAPKGHSNGKFGCMECHSTKGWTPSTVDAKQHAASFGFELKGAHAGTKCSSCHTEGQFVSTPRQCEQCHLDRHRGKFAGRQCESCHDESSWKRPHNFSHAAATGFSLTGAHAPLTCAQCHGAKHDKLLHETTVGCATCHTPKHGKQFGADCLKCHSTNSWKASGGAFDHARTMFPLDRRHRAVPCLACHDDKRHPRLNPTCTTCHEDPHRGRTQMDCNDCHRADRWMIVRFDHDRSTFPLRGKHFGTPCRDCHTNDQYTGVRTECISCHRGDRARADSEHLDHRGFSFACADCHKPFKW